MGNHCMQDTHNFKGMIHIHTTYSYDGTLSLPDFVNLVINRNIDFIVLTEHAEDFDDKKMQLLVSDCNKVTTEDFLVIPGLEFNSNGIHILGIGIERYINAPNPEELIQKIHENNGLAILAHTADYKNIPYVKLKDVDMIEIWNPRYGERLSPSIKSIKISHKFRTMRKTYMVSGGLDFHSCEDLVPLYQIVSASRLTKKDILDSMKRGEFTTTKGFIEVPPLKDPVVTINGVIYLFAFVQCIPNMSKKIIRKIYKVFTSEL
jgi:predicted metal-dependent phosphoesterase TrpH